MEVPLKLLVPVSEVCDKDTTSLPGAQMSTQVPKHEKEERASVEVVLPTVIALGTYAGENPQASALELPAATTPVTPEFVAASTASRMPATTPLPPKLMLATAGRTEFVANQSSA